MGELFVRLGERCLRSRMGFLEMFLFVGIIEKRERGKGNFKAQSWEDVSWRWWKRIGAREIEVYTVRFLRFR